MGITSFDAFERIVLAAIILGSGLLWFFIADPVLLPEVFGL